MYIEKILLKNYRNINKVFLKFNPNLNLLVGDNGQGKTNLLEAIYLLGTGTSHRTNRDKEMINWNQDQALIQVQLIKKDYELKMSLNIEGTTKKAKINDNTLDKLSEMMGSLNVVLFSPEDLKLVKGSPANRRKFIDIEVSQVSSYYHHLLNKYNHILKQRNNLLKKTGYVSKSNSSNSSASMFEVWDEQLADIGSKIIKKRIEVIEKIKILARLHQRKITEGKENLEINYEDSIKGNLDKNDSQQEIKVIFKKKLVNNRNKELNRGYTIFGPHRDDLIIKINEIDVRKYGSQGQQRTVALALKLAELEFMKSEIGEYPILLLDDVFSELDAKRKNTLIEVIKDNIQTFITSVNINSFKKFNFPEYDDHKFCFYKVKSGNIISEKKEKK